jgi:hypothetical protein
MRARTGFSRRIAGSLLLVSACLLALAASAPAKADFLDDLFGGGSNDAAPAAAQRARPARAARDNFSIRLKEPRRPVAKRVEPKKVAREAAGDDHGAFVAGSRPQKPLLCADPATASDKSDDKSGEATAYLRDETLRAGDSIVTPGEIVVFKGGGACPHAPKDFVSLARSGLQKTKRSALISLQQGLKAPPPAFDVDGAKPSGPRIVGQANH